MVFASPSLIQRVVMLNPVGKRSQRYTILDVPDLGFPDRVHKRFYELRASVLNEPCLDHRMLGDGFDIKGQGWKLFRNSEQEPNWWRIA